MNLMVEKNYYMNMDRPTSSNSPENSLDFVKIIPKYQYVEKVLSNSSTLSSLNCNINTNNGKVIREPYKISINMKDEAKDNNNSQTIICKRILCDNPSKIKIRLFAKKSTCKKFTNLPNLVKRKNMTNYQVTRPIEKALISAEHQSLKPLDMGILSSFVVNSSDDDLPISKSTADGESITNLGSIDILSSALTEIGINLSDTSHSNMLNSQVQKTPTTEKSNAIVWAPDNVSNITNGPTEGNYIDGFVSNDVLDDDLGLQSNVTVDDTGHLAVQGELNEESSCSAVSDAQIGYSEEETIGTQKNGTEILPPVESDQNHDHSYIHSQTSVSEIQKFKTTSDLLQYNNNDKLLYTFPHIHAKEALDLVPQTSEGPLSTFKHVTSGNTLVQTHMKPSKNLHYSADSIKKIPVPEIRATSEALIISPFHTENPNVQKILRDPLPLLQNPIEFSDDILIIDDPLLDSQSMHDKPIHCPQSKQTIPECSSKSVKPSLSQDQHTGNLKKRRKCNLISRPEDKSPIHNEPLHTMDVVKGYSFNKSSPLSFVIQNLFELIFKYESYPTSVIMAKLAKILKIRWGDVRDWFVARRLENKRIGLLTRNRPQEFQKCQYCPNYLTSEKPQATVAHLTSKEHIIRMVSSYSLNHLYEKATNENNILQYSMTANARNLDKNKTNSRLKPIMITQGKEIQQKGSMSHEQAQLNSLKESLIMNKKIYEQTKKHYDEDSESDNPFLWIEESKDSSDIKNRNLKKRKFAAIHSLYSKLKQPLDSINLPDKYINDQSDSIVGYRCPHCNQIFYKEWLLVKHLLVHQKFICNECECIFTTELKLKSHLKEHLFSALNSDNLSLFSCPDCQKLSCLCVDTTVGHSILSNLVKKDSKHITGENGVNSHLRVSTGEFLNIWMPHTSSSSTTILQENDISNSRADSLSPATNTLTYTGADHQSYACNHSHCESFFFSQEKLFEHKLIKHHKITASEIKMMEGIFCQFCHEILPNEACLRRHLRFWCSNTPKGLSQKLYFCNTFDIELNTDIKCSYVTTQSVAECKICQHFVSVNSYGSHFNVCNSKKKTVKNINTTNVITSNVTASKRDTGKATPDISGKVSLKVNDDKKHIYICGFCSVPVKSLQLLYNHFQKICCKKSEGKSCGKIDSTYEIITTAEIKDYFTLSAVIKILDFPIMKNDSLNKFKKVRCKFCLKKPWACNILRHLLNYCFNVPTFFYNYIVKYKKSLEIKLACRERPSSPIQIIGTYDCHLCEKVFKTSSFFLKHLQLKHCMKVSEEAAKQWLSSHESDAQNETSVEQSELISEEETSLEDIAETMFITDDCILQGNENNQSHFSDNKSPTFDLKGEKSCHQIKPLISENSSTDTNFCSENQASVNANSSLMETVPGSQPDIDNGPATSTISQFVEVNSNVDLEFSMNSIFPINGQSDANAIKVKQYSEGNKISPVTETGDLIKKNCPEINKGSSASVINVLNIELMESPNSSTNLSLADATMLLSDNDSDAIEVSEQNKCTNISSHCKIEDKQDMESDFECDDSLLDDVLDNVIEDVQLSDHIQSL